MLDGCTALAAGYGPPAQEDQAVGCNPNVMEQRTLALKWCGQSADSCLGLVLPRCRTSCEYGFFVVVRGPLGFGSRVGFLAGRLIEEGWVSAQFGRYVPQETGWYQAVPP